ncbi:hypothetical protein M441DRAFT_41404 [Trichoderma asperellum CBS 433.97]|uniref:DUF676 domain-containing protein n=1 Tax=Trichoderma asperellum (strain ATCC 204424 / CBS 433.97 / NBRC 101777) TaxID=1042311 RepID=A0A2T3YS28_TRIA4|nr:hypothetical protein M441DRAFT_41404 [Trichoderma asperellum CBS 433.97]PTB35375.1 hypothetical protein M441DRAFT_41404 [Trichoderma asperellum CBS 433.97]
MSNVDEAPAAVPKTTLLAEEEFQKPVVAPDAPNDVVQGDNSDAASVKSIATDELLPIDSGHSPDTQERNVGLDIHKLGWSGSNYDDYDVVTVHGIRDDYKTAWITKKGIWWVKEQLFKGLSTRQIDYAYEVNESSELYGPDGIRLHAQRLVAEYADIRGKLEGTESDRPIIWICHDLGGTIVKEALSLAMGHPDMYGKMAILTTAIIFLGTPHHSHSVEDLEDQLHKLILLPGPEIRNQAVTKIKNLANQVNRVNEAFPATKLLDRALIFNVLTRDGGNPSKALTSLSQFALTLGHSF